MKDKRQKFIQLAEARVNKTIKDIQLIGNLSNKAAYEYSEADIRKIFVTLAREMEIAKARFGKSNDGTGGEFRL